jgi:hypothetical protein
MEDNVQICKWVCNKREKTNFWKKHKLNFSHHHWNSKNLPVEECIETH